MSSNELREAYQEFFEGKGHIRIPSAPLVPQDDPSVLFTTAGMHPLVPYLKGQVHPAGQRLTNVQKCLRTTDIEQVGDATHATVFEMLGNWSLGDYFKQEAIEWSWEFLTSVDWLGMEPNKLAVSVFAGDDVAPRDEDSAKFWRAVSIVEQHIAYLNKDENWWPAGGGAIGPQGPDTEMFFWTGREAVPDHFDTTDKRWVEIWNDVFMEFNRAESGNFTTLAQQNVDTGMGLERVIMVGQGAESIYEIDTFAPLMKLISSQTKVSDVRHQRILADHIKAATFVMADEHPVKPTNSEQGYVVRRLLRRALRSSRVLEVRDPTTLLLAGADYVAQTYGSVYPSLVDNLEPAKQAMRDEVDKFDQVLKRGLKKFEAVLAAQNGGDVLAGEIAFKLYDTYGFPIELTQELAAEHKLSVDLAGFARALKSHQQKSRAASIGKFAGGLADHSDQAVRYHTATHLLHQALRDVLGEQVVQQGSNITAERLRFDYSYSEKMTTEQVKKVEDLVNAKIAADLPVTKREMTVTEAKQEGALGLFEKKYGERVNVYTIGDYSIEICGGPHVESTGELGTFRITKEQSVSAGIRRLKASLQ
ncbi:alanine--tRNA ligase [Patescibacteria group bacterium]|nr:alanine--tRNA ligase [Patescibacteria group bacterium]